MEEKKNAILIMSDTQRLEECSAGLKELKYNVITAQKTSEAKLKLENQDFHLAVIDMSVKNFHVEAFVESIRRKEEAKNIRNHMPILICHNLAAEFVEKFSMIDNVNYLEFPFDRLVFKKKLISITSHSDVILKNTRNIAPGEYLITEGGTSHELYWILSGKLLITKLNSQEQNVILGEIYPGELVGEMSFLDNLPRSASVKALEHCEVLVIPHKKFIDVLDKQPRWFRSLMQTMSHRLRLADKKIAQKYVNSDKDEKPSV